MGFQAWSCYFQSVFRDAILSSPHLLQRCFMTSAPNLVWCAAFSDSCMRGGGIIFL